MDIEEQYDKIYPIAISKYMISNWHKTLLKKLFFGSINKN